MSKKYIHPEKLLGIGLKPIDNVINRMSLIGDKIAKEVENEVLDSLPRRDKKRLLKMIEGDRNANREGFTDGASYSMKIGQDIFKKHENKKLPIYAIGKDFFKVVKTLQRDVPVKNIILNDEFIYLKFNEKEYEGAYVTSYEDSYDDIHFTGMRIAFTPKDYSITGMKTLCYAVLGDKLDISKIKIVKNSSNLKGVRESVLIYPDDDIEKDIDIIMGVINCVIYINSRDPEIEVFKPIRKYDKKEFNNIESTRREQLCYFPVTFLNWSYHIRNYSKDETSVKPHLRWQACGVNNSEVKLVWVREHIRHYNKESKNEFTNS